MLLETAEKTTFILASFVNDCATYNGWANQQLVNWLREKPVELIEQVVPSSFPSLKETLVHIWDTQRFWLAIL